MSARDVEALRVNRTALSLGELIDRLRYEDDTRFIQEAISRQLTLAAAIAGGVSVSDGELQSAANAFRAKRKLQKASDTSQWLAQRGLSSARWLELIEEDLTISKFKEARFAHHAEKYFVENRLEFDSAILSRIVVTSEDLARELALQLREEGASFADIAQHYSEDYGSKSRGGFVGEQSRKDLGANVSSAVFGGKARSIVGPIKVGKQFQIIRIEEIHQATFTESARTRSIEALYKEWIETERERADIDIALFTSAPEPAGVA